MSKKVLIGIIVAVIVVGLVITGITLITDAEKSQITTLVEDFGKELASVSILSPEEVIVQSIQQNYSPYLTANLLMKWTFDPFQQWGGLYRAPGPTELN